jgi:membrane fusion protein
MHTLPRRGFGGVLSPTYPPPRAALPEGFRLAYLAREKMFTFRPEMIASRSDRLTGEIAIFAPIQWQLLGYLLFTAVCAAGAFLALGSYARVTTVQGEIVPEAGVAAIVPSRDGIVTALSVSDGDLVAKGAALITIQSPEFLPGGESVTTAIEAAIGRQDASLVVQARSAGNAAEARLRQNQEQREGLSSEIAEIRQQTDLQQRLVDSAGEDLKRVQAIAGRGFISARDIRTREETLLARRQQLSQLQQTLAARRSALAGAERGAAQIAAEARESAATFDASRAQVAQQAVNARGAQAYALRAPVAGQVTAITVRPGQLASSARPVMTIVPREARLRAELAVGSEMIGFIRPGQDVRIAIDTFPYERFGTIAGRVRSVAASAVERPGEKGQMQRVYPVVVDLEWQSVEAFGESRALLPGMTLSARIVTRKQSFLRWLFEPIFAVAAR